MHIDLTAHVALVTGAGRGIGKDIALALAREGVATIGTDISEETLADLHQELRAIGPQNGTLVCDVGNEKHAAATVNAILEQHGRIDLLVNNAGVVDGGQVADTTRQAWDRVMDVNLTGTFLMCRAIIPAMKSQHRGRIVNAASYAAITPRVGGVAYAASKAAVAHFTRGLAGELGPWDITVNAYAPGMIPTSMNHFAELPAAQREDLLNTLTLRRWGSSDDIANLVVFLASDQASYITGTLIDISGGKLATQMPYEAYDHARETGA